MCMCTCTSMQDYGGLGACSSRKLLEIGYFEIASEATLEQKQSCSSYAWFTRYCIQLCTYAFASQLTLNSKREGTKVGRTACIGAFISTCTCSSAVTNCLFLQLNVTLCQEVSPSPSHPRPLHPRLCPFQW